MVLTYYWVRSRVTSLVGLFVFPFVLEFLLGRAELSGLRFGHFYVFRGPGADALRHTGSLPGCAERGVLCPGGGKVGNQVKQTACRFLRFRQLNSTSFQREAKFHETAKGSEVRVHQASHGYSTALFSGVSLVCQSDLGSSGSVPGVWVVVGFFCGPDGKRVVAHR